MRALFCPPDDGITMAHGSIVTPMWGSFDRTPAHLALPWQCHIEPALTELRER